MGALSRNGSKKLVFLLFNRWTTYKVFFFIFMHDALIVRRQKMVAVNGKAWRQKNGSCQWKNLENVSMKHFHKTLFLLFDCTI